MRSSSDDDSRPYRRFKKPPDYFSRRVQLRLMMLVTMLMLVIVAMDEARDPKYYAWMWGDQRLQPVEEEVDTRLPPRPQTPEPVAPDAIRTQERPEPLKPETIEAAASASDPLERSKVDAWASALDALNISEQQQLRKALYVSRQRTKLDAAEKRRFSPVLNKVIEEWKGYVAAAKSSLEESGESELTTAEREAWTRILDQLDAHWREQWRPAFEALFQDRDLLEGERESLAEVQTILDRLGLAAVEDNTVLRSDEQGAWFRLFEALQQEQSGAAEQAATNVDFLQLYKQPKEYRGKLVTIRGVARLGYRVRAPKNTLGISEYNILWIKPRGGPNSPCVVYALETPAGFPALKSKDHEQETTTLDVDVAVTGYFFKNWAYRSKGGINVAPLLLTKAPVLKESPAAPTIGPIPRGALITVAVVMAGLAVLIAAVVYIVHSWPSRISRFHTAATGEQLSTPSDDEVRDDVPSMLKQLEQQQAGKDASQAT